MRRRLRTKLIPANVSSSSGKLALYLSACHRVIRGFQRRINISATLLWDTQQVSLFLGSFMHPLIRYGLLFLLVFTSFQTTFAQVDRSSLIGTVTDPHGARVPGATVRAIDQATGLARETVTNSQGSYVLEDLRIGLFVISFKKPGFAEFIADQVRQDVGQTRTLNVQLSVATGTQQVTVTQPLIQLDRVSATVGAPIEQKQVSDLPINGRDWATLTALVPGAIDNGAGDQRTIRFAGHGLDDNNLTLDGIDATAVFNQEQREYMRLNIPLDSITQFQVQSQNFGADVEGGTAGR